MKTTVRMNDGHAEARGDGARGDGDNEDGGGGAVGKRCGGDCEGNADQMVMVNDGV
jgi:hypothetical protein